MEVIVVDDGSSDEVFDVIRKYESRLDLRYARQEDKGFRVSAARNLGIRLSTGDGLVFFDADILPGPTDVENYMRVMHVSDQVALIGHRRYVDVSGITDDDVLNDIRVATELPDINPDNDVADRRDETGASVDWRFAEYKKYNGLMNDLWPFTKGAGGNLAASRRMIEGAVEFDEDFQAWGCEDVEFSFKLQEQGAYFIPMMDIMSLHQEPLAESSPQPPKPKGESFRAKGHKITSQLLIQKCPAPVVRRYLPGLEMTVPKVSI